ncbi:MAG: hypothetical protein HC812_07615 [Leptolyngbya sp. RL_3_1]|nr:hypothetical protein [Leptolyngbya sp. RL_3_1]
MAQIDIAAEIRSLNRALKADGHRVAVQARGSRLYLVATLPPKPNSTKRKPHQQRIALHLGASRMGLRRAKSMAILVSDQLDRDRFDWGEWTALNADDEPAKTAGEWIEALRLHVWDDLPDDKEFNWQKTLALFRPQQTAPSIAPLTSEALITVALAIPEEKSAMRDRTCRQLQRLADFAGVQVDLSPYRTGYNPSAVAPRTIPSDAGIEARSHPLITSSGVPFRPDGHLRTEEP